MRLIDADTLNFTCTADEDYKCQKIVDCNCCPFHSITSFEIENEPTVQAVPTWIPVSEKLPKNGTWNLFTDGKNVSVERYKSDAIDHFYPNGRWFSLDEAIAWMPLPQPYKAESEEI